MMPTTKEVTLVLGDEFDDMLRNDLIEVLQGLGASTQSSDWSVAGSQEIAATKILLRGQSLIIEAETYVGLSITGAQDILREVNTLIAERRARRNNS